MNVVFRDDQYLPTQGMYASTWRGDASLAGSGVLMEHSIHDVDLVEWLVGPIDSVSAHQSSFHGIDGIEDNVSVVARFVGGATGVLATVWHDVMSRPSQRRIEVVCESAMITIEGDTFGPVHCERSDGIETVGADDLVEWMAAGGSRANRPRRPSSGRSAIRRAAGPVPTSATPCGPTSSSTPSIGPPRHPAPRSGSPKPSARWTVRRAADDPCRCCGRAGRRRGGAGRRRDRPRLGGGDRVRRHGSRTRRPGRARTGRSPGERLRRGRVPKRRPARVRPGRDGAGRPRCGGGAADLLRLFDRWIRAGVAGAGRGPGRAAGRVSVPAGASRRAVPVAGVEGRPRSRHVRSSHGRRRRRGSSAPVRSAW